jgi:hypothetical protein
MNPNTGTVPIFRTRRDAELTKKLYRAAPVLMNEETGQNSWDVRLMRAFDMNKVEVLDVCRDLDTLKHDCTRAGNTFKCEDRMLLPMYEAKLIHQYDHRFNTYEQVDNEEAPPVRTVAPPRKSATSQVLPRWWIPRTQVINAVDKRDDGITWLVAYRDICRSTDGRTAIACVLPLSATDFTIRLFLSNQSATAQSGVVANLNSLVFDYVTRQFVAGTHLSDYIFKQLPLLAPERYNPELLDFIAPRVIELTHTAWDLQPFARDVLDEVGEETWARWFASDHLGSPAPVHTSPAPDWAPGTTPPPFVWDEERRARLRAELDALYGHLYGLTREELAYILDTFPIVRRKDEAEYGEYRTKRMVLEKYAEVGPLVD